MVSCCWGKGVGRRGDDVLASMEWWDLVILRTCDNHQHYVESIAKQVDVQQELTQKKAKMVNLSGPRETECVVI